MVVLGRLTAPTTGLTARSAGNGLLVGVSLSGNLDPPALSVGFSILGGSYVVNV
ncbi:MAG: hypothetical protein JWN17_1888 [Frankiales bacterium]|nr:hypothetical protein [Frankiales bacterium]